MDTDEHQWTPEGSVVWLTVVQAWEWVKISCEEVSDETTVEVF
jgi:hypothetical protein